MDKNLYNYHLKMLVLFYQHFYQRFSNIKKQSPNYIFKPSEKAFKVIDNFITEILKERIYSVGFTFYFNYFCFQWSFLYHSEKIKVMRITPNDVFTKKSFENYSNRKKDFDNLNKEFCRKLGIRSIDLKQLSEPIQNPIKLETEESFDIEEWQRNRFPADDNRRFTNCVLTTTLYAKSSSCVIDCYFKSSCKKLKYKLYPELCQK